MLIAVTSQGKDLAGEVEPRFGRAKHFLLVDSETMHLQVVENHQSLFAAGSNRSIKCSLQSSSSFLFRKGVFITLLLRVVTTYRLFVQNDDILNGWVLQRALLELARQGSLST